MRDGVDRDVSAIRTEIDPGQHLETSLTELRASLDRFAAGQQQILDLLRTLIDRRYRENDA